jgi:hypothetical protein
MRKNKKNKIMEDKGDFGLLLLQEALDIRRKVLDQVPGAKITDARAKLELACEQNNKYALYLKARALEYGGFGYGRECRTIYQPVYDIARALGCNNWIHVASRFSIGLDDENDMHIHMWNKYERKRIPDLTITAGVNNKDRVLLFTAAQNGHSECARLLWRQFSIFYTIYEQMSFYIIARSDIMVLVSQYPDDLRLSYMAGRFFLSFAGRNYTYKAPQINPKRLFCVVNKNCKKSVLAWLSTKVLMKDMMKYIGQIIWNNREIDANKWFRDEEG